MFRALIATLLPLLLLVTSPAADAADGRTTSASAPSSNDPDAAGCAARRVDRISGASRLTTATAVSTHAWSSAGEVVLASADDYPDALSGAVLAAERQAPTLLTPRDGLPREVADEIERLDPSRVWIVGGPAAVSEQVRRQVEETRGRPATTRLSGVDRYATAAAIASEVGPTDRAAISTGEAFPDAVAAGALAATPARVPTLLTPSDHLHGATRDVLTELGVETVYVVGGEVAVGSPVDAQLRDAGMEVQRLAGEDRYATSAVVAGRAADDLGDGLRGALLATGSAFPDALTAAGLAARANAVLVLTPPTGPELPRTVGDVLDGVRTRSDCNAVVGGPAAIAPETAAAVARHLELAPPDAPRPVDRPCDVVINARTDGSDQTRTIQTQIDAAPDGDPDDPTVICLPVGRSSGRYRVDGTLEVQGRDWLEIRGPSADDHATIYSDLDGITAGHGGHTGQSARRHWRVTGSRDITLRNLRAEGPFYPGNPHYGGTTRRSNNLGEPGYAYFDVRFEAEHAFDLRGSHRVSLFDTSSKDVGGDHLHALATEGSTDDFSSDVLLVDAHADHPHRHGVCACATERLLIDGLTVVKGGYDYVDFEPGGDVQQVRGVEVRNGDADVFLLAFGAEGAGVVSDVYIHHNLVRSATPTWALVHVDGGDPSRFGRRSGWSATDNVADGYPIGSCSTSGRSSAFTFVDVDDVEVRRNKVRLKSGWSCNALAHLHDVGGRAWLTDNLARDACTEYRWFVDGQDRTGTSSDHFVQYPDRRSGNDTTGDGCRS